MLTARSNAVAAALSRRVAVNAPTERRDYSAMISMDA
jgi:hypothetical protein